MSERPSKNYIKIGVASQTHGVRGSFVLKTFQESENGTVLKKGQQVLVTSPSSKQEKLYTIQDLRIGQKILVTLEGISSLEQIKKILPLEIALPREEFPLDRDEDEFYLADLIGHKVIDAKSGEEVGLLESSYPNGAQEVFVIKLLKEGVAPLELPFVDVFFPKIDREKKEIYLNQPTFIEDDERS